MPSPARLVTLPFCRIVMLGEWDESPRRRFAAYRCSGRLPRVLGHAVIDEFATLSSPVFFCPRALAGKIYDVGITLAHRRDPDMAIDQGWPPLVVAQDPPPTETAPDLPADWQQQLLDALRAPAGRANEAPGDGFASRLVGKDRLDWARIGRTDVLVTSAPLLPRQLGRLCETSPLPFAIAVSQGPFLVRSDGGRSQSLPVVSEERLEGLVTGSRALLVESAEVFKEVVR